MTNFRNAKGITLIILVITIILMSIIFGITFSTANDLLRNSQKNRLRTNLYLVQSRAAALLEDYLFYYDEDAYTESAEAIAAKAKLGTLLTNSSDYASYNWSTVLNCIYAKWTLDDVKAQGIDTSNIATGEAFIIQYNLKSGKVDVASTKGVTDSDGKSFFVLSEF